MKKKSKRLIIWNIRSIYINVQMSEDTNIHDLSHLASSCSEFRYVWLADACLHHTCISYSLFNSVVFNTTHKTANSKLQCQRAYKMLSHILHLKLQCKHVSLSVPNYKSLWLFWFIYFDMYLDIIYYIYIHSKIDVQKKVKSTYNLELSEYLPLRKIIKSNL
jgi:hypothetical protein